MLLYPAIDIMGGQVVRLEQGEADRKTVYSDDPPAIAQEWERAGGNWIHMVDLDGAYNGKPSNLDIVTKTVETVHVPCQLGGGIRTLGAIERALNAGATRVVLGTRAAESVDFVAEAIRKFDASHVAVGIDAKGGMVAVRGWTETSALKATDLARKVEDVGVKTIIYTDVATDGMLKGPNYDELARMAEVFGGDVIASGGVSCAEDVLKLRDLGTLHGTIIGKALYDKKLDLAALARELGQAAVS